MHLWHRRLSRQKPRQGNKQDQKQIFILPPCETLILYKGRFQVRFKSIDQCDECRCPSRPKRRPRESSANRSVRLGPHDGGQAGSGECRSASERLSLNRCRPGAAGSNRRCWRSFAGTVFRIGLIACGQGLLTRGGAAAVGARTTTAVVLAIFSVIVISALFTFFFALMGI